MKKKKRTESQDDKLREIFETDLRQTGQDMETVSEDNGSSEDASPAEPPEPAEVLPAESGKEPDELKKKKKTLYIYAGAILVLALALILFSYIGQLRVNSSLESEKEKSLSEAKSITQKYNTLLADYDALKKEKDAALAALEEAETAFAGLSKQSDALGANLSEKEQTIASLNTQLAESEKLKAAYEMQANLSLTYRKTRSPYTACKEIIAEMEEAGAPALLTGDILKEYNYIKSKVK